MDTTITLGNILTVGVFLGGLLMTGWKFSLLFARIESKYEMKVDMMWKDYCQRKGIDPKETNNGQH